jgi:hypothetical protein
MIGHCGGILLSSRAISQLPRIKVSTMARTMSVRREAVSLECHFDAEVEVVELA